MADNGERFSNDAKRASPGPLIPDAWQRLVTASYGVPVRREHYLASLPVPSGTLLLIDPTQDLGIEIPGIVERQALVQPKVWSLVDGTSLVGSVSVYFTQPSPELLFQRHKVRSLGRVLITSGVIVIVDRDVWQTRPPSVCGDNLHHQIDQNGFGEVLINASTGSRAVLLPTGYGAGKYAAVASFHEDRIIDVNIFMLKGNCP